MELRETSGQKGLETSPKFHSGTYSIMKLLNTMLSMLAADVLHAEVVDHERERDWPPIVSTEAGHEFALPVPIFVEPFLQLLLRY